MSAAFTRLTPSILANADGLQFMREDCLSSLLDETFGDPREDSAILTAWRQSRGDGEVRAIQDQGILYFCIADSDRFVAKHAPGEMTISQRLEPSAIEASLRLVGSWCRERDAIEFLREQHGGSLREHHAWLKRDRRRRSPVVPFWSHFDEIRYAWDDLYRYVSHAGRSDLLPATPSAANDQRPTMQANTIVDYANRNRLMVQIAVGTQDDWMRAAFTPAEARDLAGRLTEIADACDACEFDAQQWRVAQRGNTPDRNAREVAR